MYPLTLAFAIENKLLWDEVEGCLADLPVKTVLRQSELGELGVLLERLERTRPNVILLDISKAGSTIEQTIRALKSVSTRPAVIALHPAADPEAILNAMRAGAVEYLFPPLQMNLRRALDRLSEEKLAENPGLNPGGKTVGFLSAKGGCGATTLACHTAIEIQRLAGERVLLADLDLDAGIIGFLTRSKSSYSVLDALQNLHRLDASYWKGLVYSNGIPNLEIITAPPARISRAYPPPESVLDLLHFVRGQYSWSLADLGRSMNQFTAAALEVMDELCLVTTLEIPALHRAKQMIKNILEGGFRRDRLHLVLNRVPKRSDITIQELEQMLGLPAYAALPDEYTALSEAYTEGKLLPGANPLSRQIARLAARIAGVEEQQKRKKALSIFG